ncbi:MAG: 50S ribosomal protein L35 [Deltaproteobacteria bacterium]|nr:50S ribosomal protein L35 [Deltaproteobacteria bacterium]
MPKLKSKRGAKKRFKVTATGKVMAGQMNKRHILTGKPKKRKRQLRGTRVVNKVEQKRLRIALLA